jgi:oligopeptide transport system substrate-binding protein
MARPQPQWVIEEAGELWIEPENFVSYGPFALWEWNHLEYISIIKNPFWTGTAEIPAATIDGVQFRIMDSVTALAEYEAGNLDTLDVVDTASIPRIEADPVLSTELDKGAGACSYYYGFSIGIEPFNNVHMRRAFSFAVDREQIVNEVTLGGETPATYFTLPSLNAAPQPEGMDELGYGIGYDPEAAVEELEIAMEELGYADVSAIPPISLLYNTSEGHRRIAEAIRDMWSDTLGIEVQLVNQDFAVYLDQRASFQVWRAGWCFDYPDAHNFLFDVFSTTGQSDTGYSSEAFDALVEEAASSSDTAHRIELYAEAEQLLVYEDAAIIPIYWYSDLEMTKPYLERTYAVDNSEQFENWSFNR